MTFPLSLQRDEPHYIACSLSLSLQHFMMPLTMFLSTAEMEKVFVNIPVSCSLQLHVKII